MKLNEIIEVINEVRPHNYSEKRVKGFIEDCDKRVYREVAEHFEDTGLEPYEERYPLGTNDELIVDDAYSMLYVWYALCQMDLFNAETDRYVNDMIVFNDYYTSFENFYSRTHSFKSTVSRIITD